MTLFEILYINREYLNRVFSTGFKLKDCRLIDLYSEYEQMCQNGDKITYIVSVLSEKYGISERKVYSVIGQLKKDCTV